MNELLTRLKLAWRVLCGKVAMSRITAPGTIELDMSQSAHVIKCEFKPSSWRMEIEKEMLDD